MKAPGGVQWNPWHGCHKYSAGCVNCYVYRRDESIGKDASLVQKTGEFSLPVKKNRVGEWKIPAGETVWTCFTSDFLLEDADPWRPEAFLMMRQRADLSFVFFTKRIERLAELLPHDWKEGYENVTIGCTCENQEAADRRLPVFLALPIQRRLITTEPMLGHIDLSPYLGPKIGQVIAGGESGDGARPLNYDWVLDLRNQCQRARVSFFFKQTGARFVKDGKLYAIERRLQHSQAKKAGINLSFS